MTATLTQCALCGCEFDGIPYGPADAEVCLSCWHKCGSYQAVRKSVDAVESGRPAPTEEAPEISDWNRGRIVSAGSNLDYLSGEIDDALEDADLDALDGLVSDIERTAWDLRRAIDDERGRREKKPRWSVAAEAR